MKTNLLRNFGHYAVPIIALTAIFFASCNTNFKQEECPEYAGTYGAFINHVQTNIETYRAAQFEDIERFEVLEQTSDSCRAIIQTCCGTYSPFYYDYDGDGYNETEMYDVAYPDGYTIIGYVKKYAAEIVKTQNIKDIDKRKAKFESRKKKLINYIDRKVL